MLLPAYLLSKAEWIYRRAQCKHIEAVIEEQREAMIEAQRQATRRKAETAYPEPPQKKKPRKYKITPQLFDTTLLKEGSDESIDQLVKHIE